jgi:hypothetical protein
VGPQVPHGNVLEGTKILDLAPTILAYFGVTPPDYMEGTALGELCDGPKRLTPAEITSEIAVP